MTVPLDLFPDTVRITPGNRLAIGGCDLVDLAERFGTPLYIYDSATILARAKTYREALAAWAPAFADQTGGCPTASELRLLADCLYLPHVAGSGGERLLSEAVVMVRGSTQARRRVRHRFLHAAAILVRWQTRITELKDRELSYTLYRFVWELKEEVDLLQRFVAWSDQPARSRGAFRSIFHQPGTYRGGGVARLQRLLALSVDGSIRPA